MGFIKTIGMISVFVIFFVVLITEKNVRKYITNILSKKFLNKISVKNILIFMSLICFALFVRKTSISIKNNISDAKKDFTDDIRILDETALIKEFQLAKYNDFMEENYDIENCKNPYIPDNFEHVEGEWNNGFVIEDVNGNQFVWIPCTNIDNKLGIPILEKRNLNPEHYASYNSCYEQDDYEEFIKSCLENGGFYISRFEIGNENGEAVSKFGVDIWTNIDWINAEKIAEEMYTTINSKLINGYAFDTAISFIYDDIDLTDIAKSSEKSGTKSYKNIYDLVDNMFEWTSEMRYQDKIIRGCTFDGNKLNLLDERLGNSSDFSADLLGFRIIIYN